MQGTVEGPATSALNPSGDVDQFGRKKRRIVAGKRQSGQLILDLWQSNEQDWQANYWSKIDESVFHLMGGSRFILPDNFLPNLQDKRGYMVVIFPQKITTPLKILSLIGNKRCKVMRYAVGISMPAEAVSTDVETWTQAVIDHDVDGRPLVNYPEIAGRLLLEGAVVVKALSSDAHWRKSITWLDMIDQEEYDDLPKSKRRRYRPEDQVKDLDDDDDADDLSWTRDARRTKQARYVRVDKEGVPVPRRRYHRDARGRTRDDAYYTRTGRDKKPRKFEEDRSATRRAYEADQKDWLARRLPFEVEVISARHCIPFFDDNERLEAMLVARQYEPEDLLAKDFIWGDDLPMLKPDDDGPVTVYELWHTDERERPCVSYFVDGYQETKFRRETEDGEELMDAVLDLQREYGCTRMPIRWLWGLNFPMDDLTKKAVPFLWPVLSSLNAAEGLATATHIYAWRNAFSGNLIQIDPAMLDRYGDILIKNAEVFKFSLGPMENAVVPGRPVVAAVPPPGAGVQQLLQMLLQASASMSPSEAVFGGTGAASGHDRALSKEYLEIALSQVLDSSRLAVKFLAEQILEYAVWIAEKTGKKVPVYANVPVSPASVAGGTETGTPGRPSTTVIELSPTWLKQNTEIHTYFEEDEANELERSQLAQQHMNGLVPWDEYRQKAWNDPSPEITLAKIFGDQALRTPEGRQEVLEFARQLWGDEQEQEKQRLIDEGLLSKDGVPTAARVPFIPKRQRQMAAGQLELPNLDPAALQSVLQGGDPNAPLAGIGAPPAGMAALPPGVVPPPGVPPELLARHLQLDRSHAFARALEAPSGPLGPIGGPANAAGVPIPGSVPGGPVGLPVPQNRPAITLPPGVPGAANIRPYPPQFAAAPTMPGMGQGADPISDALGGVIAGQLRKQAQRYHARRQAQGRLPGMSS